MTTKQIIEAVLFDVDGVVVVSELLHLLTFNELLKPLGIQISENDWKARFVGAGSLTIMTTLFKEHNISDDPRPWVDQRRELYSQHVAKGDLHPVPGFRSLYNSVLEANLPIAFVSTGHPTSLNATLRSLKLKIKHPVIDGTKVSQLKPNPEAYLLAARTLGKPASNCLVFEDSPIGVAAAKSAKMICVALTTTNLPEDLSEADLIIDNFEGWSLFKIIDVLGLLLPK